MAREHAAFLLAGLAAGALLLLVLGRAGRALRRRAASKRARRRSAHALEGERDAESLLAEAGYAVVDRQPRITWTVICDGEEVSVDLRADLLVEREGLRYVAEVKTGDAAPRLSNSSTRRQLLEYRVAYDVDAALLVDMEARCVAEVEFSVPGRLPVSSRPSRTPWRVVIASALAAAAASASLTGWLLQ